MMEAACDSAASWHLASRSKKKGQIWWGGWRRSSCRALQPKNWYLFNDMDKFVCSHAPQQPQMVPLILLHLSHTAKHLFLFFFSWKIISRCCLSTATFYQQKPQRHSYHADEERFHLLHSKKSFQLHVQRCLLLSIKLHFSFIWFVQFDTFSLLMLLYRYFQAQ